MDIEKVKAQGKGGFETRPYDIHPLYHRRSIRLKDYDYSQSGGYFFTIVTHRRNPLFGNVKNSEMRKNQCGEILQSCWQELPGHYRCLELDGFIIMPDHAHGIIMLTDPHEVGLVKAGLKPARTELARTPLSEIIRALKTFTARRINEFRQLQGNPVWQVITTKGSSATKES